MNFDGMGALYSEETCKGDNCETEYGDTRPANGPFATDNNNLFWVAMVLEGVYKDAKFGPEDLPHFEISLYESGKSRADLWAFAGLFAVQKAKDNHNERCDPEEVAPCLNQIDENSENCGYELPYLEFKFGRSDCTPSCSGDNAQYPFCTSVHELHPNPNSNGDGTVKFFEDTFGFNPKETAALMGAHTLGNPVEFNSMFRHYPWAEGKEQLNNMYYKNIVDK